MFVRVVLFVMYVHVCACACARVRACVCSCARSVRVLVFVMQKADDASLLIYSFLEQPHGPRVQHTFVCRYHRSQ